ncbi:class I SAM-dependent methyltransferase [Neobacillus muris]|uniref:class I SAM-dependent methyltransferase n=1 Tax=Neobacillus muris TaxID=2941334 RepID=UPI00203FE4B9|nr:class I SAM-dependent methyltransferase [Neobacillus muris]
MGGLTYFDFLAKFGVGGAHPGGIGLTKNMLLNENITEQSFVLDAGCGTGQSTAYLYQQYKANVWGLEINPIMIEKAKDRFKNLKMPIQLTQGSVESMPFEDNTFDFVLSESVLAFVNKPNAIQEFYRVLKPGGRIIANEMTINQPLNDLEASEIKQFYAIDSLLLENDWKEMFEAAGFQNVQITGQIYDLKHSAPAQEFNFSRNFEPELFGILNQHGNMLVKYHDVLSYRIISCSKN